MFTKILNAISGFFDRQQDKIKERIDTEEKEIGKTSLSTVLYALGLGMLAGALAILPTLFLTGIIYFTSLLVGTGMNAAAYIAAVALALFFFLTIEKSFDRIFNQKHPL